MRLRRIEDRSVTLCLDEGLLGRRWLVLRHLSILLCNMTFVVGCPRMMLRFKGRRVCSYYAVCCGDAQECICICFWMSLSLRVPLEVDCASLLNAMY
ncbi:hypothetical protein BDV98DRAFT_252005 [Pterulicium gracile]|uniref:Uncharacterized protein n=1 Tax=Pterulicium gracile TaxID=1884261 RepID=A0A5C3Q765_9AGAR|nr:hypothetical protein BDV98DRAFT_252005 [Pterula gracilis]